MKRILFILLSIIAITSLQAKEVAFLGVETEDISFNSYIKYDITDGYGIYLTKVIRNSAADDAGLKKGMILREFDNEKIYTRNQLTRMIQNKAIGDKVAIRVFTDGNEKTLKATLGKRIVYEAEKHAWLGVQLKEKILNYYYKEKYGLEIVKIVEESPSEAAGLKDGDILMAVNDDKLYSIDQLNQILKNHTPDEVVNIIYWRNGKKDKLKLILGERDLLFPNMINLPQMEGLPQFFDDIDIDLDLEDLFSTWDKLGLPGAISVVTIPDSSDKLLGVIVTSVDEDAKESQKLKSGVIVKSVLDGTTALKGGILAGDVIIKINGEVIDVKDDISTVIADIDEGQEFKVNVIRDGNDKELIMIMQPAAHDHHKKYNFNINNESFIKVILDDDEASETYNYNWSSEDSLDCDKFDVDEIEIDLKKNKGNRPL